jgi:outer membrane protein assembly factor BamE (lipoprotein component of BamABCDE complex)
MFARCLFFALLSLPLVACSTGEILTRGHVMSDETASNVKIGDTQDQVLSTLGTPSTIATVNGDVFYYISQKYSRPLMFMTPKLIDQKVFAIYFNKTKKVERIANYGMQDGAIFDFISRTTQSGGQESNLLRQVLEGPRN